MSAFKRLLLKLKAEQLPSVTVSTSSRSVSEKEAFRGAVVSNLGASAATTFSLPEAKVGMRVTALVLAAQALRLDPFGTQTISLPATGVQQAAGKYVEADAVGEGGQWICIVAGRWDHIGINDGTWTAEA